MDHDKLHPYPLSLPDGWLLHLIGLARGTTKLDPKRDGHFLWHVGGFAASKVDTHLPVMPTFGAGDPIAELEAYASSGLVPNMETVLAVVRMTM